MSIKAKLISQPYSFTNNVVAFPAIEQQTVQEITDNSFPYRYGIVRYAEIDIKKEATVTNALDYKTWHLRIESHGALSIGIFFKEYHIPPESQLLLYNDDKSIIYGAFTDINNNADNSLAIADFPGNYLIIEYFEPNDALFEGQLVIGKVTHAFKNVFSEIKTKAAIDDETPGINCPEGSNVQDIKHAVCKITFSDTEFSYMCSGSLINNTNNDGTPYYLTAAHCLTRSDEAKTVVAWFDYEENYCNGPTSTPKTLSGAELVSSYSPYDFTLLRFRTMPPATYQPFYAGWDARDVTINSGFCIHHPDGKPKKISITNQNIRNFKYKIKWDKGITSPENTHWEVIWDVGATEQGSSGSSLFDNKKRIIGQLHGGDGTSDYFGKLSIAWQTQKTDTNQLKKWLDPKNSDTLICDAYVPPMPPESRLNVQFNIPCINAPITLSDSSLFNATNWLWEIFPEDQVVFLNGTTRYSKNPQVAFISGGFFDISLTAGNEYGTDTRIEKAIINAGLHIEPSIAGITSDSFICSCVLKNLPVIGNGADSFLIEIAENSDHFDITYHEDTMYLNLNEKSIKQGSFHTRINLKAFHGSCSSDLSKDFDVIIPVNDNIVDAFELKTGYNGAFDNKCATVENNEPFPSGNSCTNEDNWCPEETGKSGPVSNSLWFRFDGPESGIISIITAGFDNQMALYRADSYENVMNDRYELIAASDDLSNNILNAMIQKESVESGNSYWLQIDGSKGEKTGVSEIYFYNYNLEIFPNPTYGDITLKIYGPLNHNLNMSIYTTSGQEIYTSDIEPSDPVTISEIHLHLNKGLYLVKVKSDEIAYTRILLAL